MRSLDENEDNSVPSNLAQGHVSDEQLLSALDGELPGPEKAHVGSHLEACWTCRVRSIKLTEAIALLVEYRSHLIGSQQPISPGSRNMFAAKLDRLADTLDRPSLAVRFRALWRQANISRRTGLRHLWVSSAAIGVLFVLWSVGLFRHSATSPKIPDLSAGQLLEFAQASEVHALRDVAEPVVFRKLRIRAGKHSVTRTVYCDVKRGRRSDHLAVANDDSASSVMESDSSSFKYEEQDLQRIFQEASLNWEEPLSPASYRAWRDSLSQRQEAMTEGSDGLTTLRTVSAEGLIAAASITIRRADFHSVAADFSLRDARHVKVDELDWQVLPLETVNPAIFLSEPAVVPVITTPPPAFPVDNSADLLEEAELQARVALHVAKGDLGEEVEFYRHPASRYDLNLSLILRGIVTSPKRKAELVAALRGIPNLDVQLRTVDEIIEHRSQDIRLDDSRMAIPELVALESDRSVRGPIDSDSSESPELVKLSATDAWLWDERLQSRFSHSDERIIFTNRLIQLAHEVSSRAWALRRLSDRYGPEEVARLNPGQSGILELLIRDHVLALRSSVEEVKDMITTLLGSETASAFFSQPSTGEVSTPTYLSDDWRQMIGDAFDQVDKVHANVVVLLGQPNQSVPDQSVRIQQLRSALANLRAQLPVLGQLVSDSFLRNTKDQLRVSER